MTVHASSSYSHPHTRTHALHMPLFLAVKFQRGCSALFPSPRLPLASIREECVLLGSHTHTATKWTPTNTQHVHTQHTRVYVSSMCVFSVDSKWRREGEGLLGHRRRWRWAERKRGWHTHSHTHAGAINVFECHLLQRWRPLIWNERICFNFVARSKVAICAGEGCEGWRKDSTIVRSWAVHFRGICENYQLSASTIHLPKICTDIYRAIATYISQSKGARREPGLTYVSRWSRPRRRWRRR